MRQKIAVTAILCIISAAAVCSAAGDKHEARLMQLVNQIRTKQNLKPLRPCVELNRSASRYAKYMAEKGFFDHTGPDGSTVISRNVDAGYEDWIIVAENLAAGYTNPDDVVKAWMKSKPHRRNLLLKDIREMGVAHVYVKDSEYGHYWVQELGARAGKRD